MSKGLTVGHVRFIVKAPPALRERIRASAAAAGVEWFLVVSIMDRMLNEVCKQAAQRQLAALADYEPEQWLRLDEVEAERANATTKPV